jgi:hypothetical protein
MALSAVKLPGAAGPPFHLKMISSASFHPHVLKPFEPHPRLTAGLEKCFFGRKKLGEFLEGKMFQGPAFRGIQKTFTDIISMAGKKLPYTVAGYQINANAVQRGWFLFYEQH